MFVKNYSQPPQIQANKIQAGHTAKAGKSDLTYPVYRKSCRVGSDHQAHVLPHDAQASPSLSPTTEADPSVASPASSPPSPVPEEETAPLPASAIDLEAVVSSAEYLEFERRAKEVLLFPGAVTRYLKSPRAHPKTSIDAPKSATAVVMGHLDLVCCVSRLPPCADLPTRYVIFDGSTHHCCEAHDLAQPYPDHFHFPTLFGEQEGDVVRSLHTLETQLQLVISSQYSAPQLRALNIFFSSWTKFGGDLQSSYHCSAELRSLISFRELVSLYYRHLPYLSRNEGFGLTERIKALYSCAFALQGVSPQCCQQESAVASGDGGGDGCSELGSWGSDEETRDVFFPHKGTKFFSSSGADDAKTSSAAHLQNRKRVEQVDIETGEVIQSYESGATAGRATGIEARAISKCCHGKSRSVGGFIWRFQDSDAMHRQRPSASTGGGTQRLPERVRTSHYPARQVQALDLLTGDVLTTHSSIAAASLATGTSSSAVWKCCIGVQAEAGGFKWRFNDQSNASPAPLKVNTPHLTSVADQRMDESDESDEEAFRPSIFERTGPKQVEQLDLDTGEVISVYPSGVAAGRSVGIGQKSISDCCHGRRAAAGGFGWRFLLDHTGTCTSPLLLSLFSCCSLPC
jgi:hypothetical protein